MHGVCLVSLLHQGKMVPGHPCRLPHSLAGKEEFYSLEVCLLSVKMTSTPKTILKGYLNVLLPSPVKRHCRPLWGWGLPVCPAVSCPFLDKWPQWLVICCLCMEN